MGLNSMMSISIAYQEDGQVRLRSLQVSAGSQLQEVIAKLCKDLYPPSLLSRDDYALAVFGKKKSGDYVLQEGDRIEICLPLIIQPMDIRRRRAKREHKGGKM